MDRSSILAVFSMMVFGTAFWAIVLALRDIPPVTLGFLRAAIAAMFMGSLYLFMGFGLKRTVWLKRERWLLSDLKKKRYLLLVAGTAFFGTALPNMLQNIEKAIHQSDLGLNPNNDGHIIRLTIPQLTEERRKDILKLVKKFGEDAKIAIRNVRRDAIEKLRAAQKESAISEDDLHRGEKEAQELTDKHIEEIDKIIAAKEEDIMTV